eukprot:scaffold398_cov356-Pavlova_lutheri.AAC.5
MLCEDVDLWVLQRLVEDGQRPLLQRSMLRLRPWEATKASLEAFNTHGLTWEPPPWIGSC